MNKKILIFIFVGFFLIISIFGYVAVSGGIFVGPSFEGASVSSLEKGLVGHWTLDEINYNSNTNRVTDKSAYSNHGTNYGATFTTDRMGGDGGAMSFGTRSNSYYIALGNNNSLQITGSQTISMWLKPTNVAEGRQNPYEKAYGGEGTITQEVSGSLTYYWGTYGGDSSPYQGFGMASTIQNGQWTHIVLVRDLNTGKLKWYKNGILINQGDASYAQAKASSKNVLIGTGYAGSYSGLIDEVRVYDRALSEDEVKLLYDSYKPKVVSGSLQKGLILDMPLSSRYTKSEVVGSEIITDRTPSSNDGQNYGATLGSEGASFVSNDWVDLPYGQGINPSTNPHSFSMWVKSNSPASAIMFFSSGQSPNSNARMYLGTTGGDWEMGIQSSGWGVGTKDVTTDWTHISVVMDGSVAKMYINGEFDHQKSYTSYTFNQNFDIGRHADGSYYWNGQISNVKIYDRALSATEVKSLYDKGRY